MLPAKLEEILKGVSARRCATCHEQGVPRKVWTRITNPHLNNFLLAPLAKAAGGTEQCGKAVFQSTADPDYEAILETFGDVTRLLEKTPRMDMARGPKGR